MRTVLFLRRLSVTLAFASSPLLFAHCNGEEMMGAAAPDPSDAGVCDGHFFEFADGTPTEASCNAAARGEWLELEERCYCHGE